MRIIPVASGKGGVGKSLLAANLSIAFAQAGQRVVAADLDLGASNLHMVLGCQAPKAGIGTFLNNPRADFNKAIIESGVPGLRFLAGDTEIPGLANLKPGQLKALARRLLALAPTTDILVLDLGAGTHQSILDFFLLSGQGVVVTAPAVTAVLNAYVFLKNAVFRLMYTVFGRDSKARACLDEIRRSGGSPQALTLPALLPRIARIDRASCNRFQKRLQAFRPRLVMNMIENPEEGEIAGKIRRSCEEYLSLGIEHLGSIYRDGLQDTALASRLPIIIYKPQSLLAQGVYRIAGKILQSPEDAQAKAGALTDEEIDASFQEAEAEAEADFGARMDYVSELLHSGALTQGDLVETVKTQQLEIAKIKKENNFLKLKLSKALALGYKV